jgi:uncharacterized protein YuzE
MLFSIGDSSHENPILPKHRYLIEFRDTPGSETRDLVENTLLDLDAAGNICAITVEHASERADIPRFSYEQLAA